MGRQEPAPRVRQLQLRTLPRPRVKSLELKLGMTRLLLCDDHAMFRQGLRSILETEEDFRVIGEAATGREAVLYALETRPDVTLMDLQMPELDGVAATKAILAEQPEAKVIVLTMYRQDRYVFEAIKAGARGYMLKDSG